MFKQGQRVVVTFPTGKEETGVVLQWPARYWPDDGQWRAEGLLDAGRVKVKIDQPYFGHVTVDVARVQPAAF